MPRTPLRPPGYALRAKGETRRSRRVRAACPRPGPTPAPCSSAPLLAAAGGKPLLTRVGACWMRNIRRAASQTGPSRWR
eukprot:631811-Prymnesium_polylepis.1